MGNSKKFNRQKQQNNKASKSRKERQHNKKKNAAAMSAEANTNYDSNDLETMVALMDSIADTYTNSKCKGLHVSNSVHSFKSCPPLGIPNSPGVYIPKMETHTGFDDQTPPDTMTCYIHDLKTMDTLGVSVVLSDKFSKYNGPPVKNSVGNLENWVGIPGVYIPERETCAGCDNQTGPATVSCYSHDLKTMDTSGVSVVLTQKFSKYNGPPVKNSAGNLENWVGIPGVYIPKRETCAGCDDQTGPATVSCYSGWETMDTLGVSVVRTHKFPEYNGPPVKNSAGNLENWVGIPGVFIPKTKTRTGYDNQTAPATVSCYSHDCENMDTSGVSVVRTHKFPEYNDPPVKNSAGKAENWAALGNPYIF